MRKHKSELTAPSSNGLIRNLNATIKHHFFYVTKTIIESKLTAPLTKRINDESEKTGIKEKCDSFAIFFKDESLNIIAGVNGFLIYGSIYTDQLWVATPYRHKGYGKSLMKRVHEYGLEHNCKLATVSTMSFQGACHFYKKLGYEIDFTREGYTDNSSCIYLSKALL